METKSEKVQISLGDIFAVERQGGLDVNLYEGTKWKIEEVEVLKDQDPFHDEAGNPTEYNPDSKAMCFRLYVYTEPLREINPTTKAVTDKILETTDKEGNSKPIRVRARFNLQTNTEGKPEISKNPKALLWRFMRKMGALTLNDLKGKLVMLDSEPSKAEGDDRRYLRIVTQ